jgi:hypothetical protein
VLFRGGDDEENIGGSELTDVDEKKEHYQEPKQTPRVLHQ